MDAILLQAILSVYADGGWHALKEVYSQAGRGNGTRGNRSDMVRWIREHTTIDGEDRRAHFTARPPLGLLKRKEATYRLSSDGLERLGVILRRKQGVQPMGPDHHKMTAFLSLNPGKFFSSADLSDAVFQGKASPHRVTTVIRGLRQQGYVIEDEADPADGTRRLFRFVRLNPILKRLTLNDVALGFLNMGVEQGGVLSVENVQSNFTHGDRARANYLLHKFADRLNRRVPNGCRVITSKARYGILIRIEFDPSIPHHLALATRLEPRARLRKGYALCAKHIVDNGGSIPYQEFLTFAGDACGIKNAQIFGCRMVEDGYLVKDKAGFQLKNVVVDRVTNVRLSDDFPIYLLDADTEPDIVPVSVHTSNEVPLKYCTDRFGYLASDLPDQPVRQFKMWVRELVDGQPGPARVRINSMYSGNALWTTELAEVLAPVTIDLAHAVCHLLEQNVGNSIGDSVRLGTPKSLTVLAKAIEYGFVPYLFTLSKEQQTKQSIACLHLPTQIFCAIFVQNGIQDIASLIRARENGTVILGIGARSLSLVDDALSMFYRKSTDQSFGDQESAVSHPFQQFQAFISVQPQF